METKWRPKELKAVEIKYKTFFLLILKNKLWGKPLATTRPTGSSPPPAQYHHNYRRWTFEEGAIIVVENGNYKNWSI